MTGGEEMLELILGGVLFACCAYTGMGIRAYYRKRKEMFEQYAGYLDYLQEDIGFLKTPLVECTREYCKGKKGEFIKILSRYCSMLEEGKVSREDFDELFSSPYIEKRYRKELSYVFYGLGKVDADTQTENLRKARAAAEAPLNFYKKKYETTGTLAFKLGVVLGIAAMILAA